MSKRIFVFGIAAAFVAIGPAQAQISNNFDVSVTLSSQCRATNDSTETVDFGTYTAFQAGIQDSSVAGSDAVLTYECTRGFAPASVAFDTINGTAAGVGVLAGLQYTLTASAAVVAAGTAASTATIGTGDTRTYTVNGTMPADQAGTGAGGPATHVRTLILTY